MVGAKKRVLIIQTAFLGDLLLSVPLLKNLRLCIPNCEIYLVCRKGFSSFFKELGLIDHGFEIQKKNSLSYQAVTDELSKIQFDLILSPHESFTSARLVRKMKSPIKIGFTKWWNSFFFHERIQKDLKLPEALRQISLLENRVPDLRQQFQNFKKVQLEYEKNSPDRLAPVPEWASPDITVALSFVEVANRFSLPSTYICLFPGSVWATKQWTPEGFIELGQKFSLEGHPVVIMGGPGEEDLGAQVAAHIPGSMSLVNKTSLMETLAVLKGAQLVVTNDSAGQHLAALVQAPTVSVFGPTVQEFGYRPWNTKAIVIERKHLICRPCGKHGHHLCPLGTHECMKSIRASEVYSAAQKLNQSL